MSASGSRRRAEVDGIARVRHEIQASQGRLRWGYGGMDRRSSWVRRPLGAVAGLMITGLIAAAQEPAPTPPLPPPAPATGEEGGDTSTPVQEPTGVEDRLKRLEESNRLLMEQNKKLLDRLDGLSKQYDTLSEKKKDEPKKDGSAKKDDGGADTKDDQGRDTGSPAAGRGLGDTTPKKKAGKVLYGPGFEIASQDDEYTFQLHDMTAIDYRGYTDANRTPYHSGFFIARQRLYFSGRVTKPIEYYASLNRSYAFNFDVLDAYFNINYDPRFQVRIGRYRAPFSYEWYANPIYTLVQPERSLFALNFGMNRMLGAMLWGQLSEKRIDYAVGMFNGPRNSFEDNNSAKDVMAYLNVRPFESREDLPWLRYLNIGGSADWGSQDNPLWAQTMRTSVNASNNASTAAASPPFLTYNSNVTETGDRAFWSAHAAYFRKGLSLIAEVESGFDDMAASGRRVQLPVTGWYVQAGYFLTGEEVKGRTNLKPRRSFDLRKGKVGLGAIEPAVRYAALDIGPEVFTGGLADPNLWTRRLNALDVGVNWYLNEYLRLYFLWEHVEFGSPVLQSPGHYQATNDLFWMRMMLYF